MVLLKLQGLMHYLKQKLADNLERARLNGGFLDVYDNTASGQELLDAFSKENLKKKRQYGSAVLNQQCSTSR